VSHRCSFNLDIRESPERHALSLNEEEVVSPRKFALPLPSERDAVKNSRKQLNLSRLPVRSLIVAAVRKLFGFIGAQMFFWVDGGPNYNALGSVSPSLCDPDVKSLSLVRLSSLEQVSPNESKDCGGVVLRRRARK
jgi:hypothetical protein